VLSGAPSFVYSLREKHALNKTIFANTSKDFDTTEDLDYFFFYRALLLGRTRYTAQSPVLNQH